MLNAAGFIYENSQGREQLVSMMERMLDKLTNFPHIPVDNIVAAMNPNIRTGRMSSSKPNTMLLPKADLGTAVGDDENEEPYTEISCTRRLQFCAGHRVLGHENKCAHPHGHNYVVLLEAAQEEDSTKVDGIGRVIDFSVLKEKVGGWIDAYWDHGFLYNKTDTIMRDMLESYGNADHSVKGDFKTFAMPYNPTAENMAKFLLHHVGPNVLAGTGVRLVRVKVWETENCVGTACVA
jgi:6-pyruvoyltetrahydropterin/6-carboxytetrahydropterin synthase